jgi:Homeodomain-like domain
MFASEVKKYVVRLSTEQREALEALIDKGKHRAAQVLKARVLLKADVARTGKGWSDGRIVRVLHTSRSTVFRTRRRLFEDGFDAVLTRRRSSKTAARRGFDRAGTRQWQSVNQANQTAGTNRSG